MTKSSMLETLYGRVRRGIPHLTAVTLLVSSSGRSISAYAPPSTKSTSLDAISLRSRRPFRVPLTTPPQSPDIALAATGSPVVDEGVSSWLLLEMDGVVGNSAASASSIVISDALSPLLHSPAVWSVLAMTSIVGLLLAWEEAIENIRHNIPKPIQPVIDSMLSEMGGIGFIGLFLSTIVTGGPLGKVIENLSEEYLGNDELLLETFEFLHTFFFQVGIIFFTVVGLSVATVLKEVKSLKLISELALDEDGDGEVSLDELAAALQVDCMIVDMDGDGVITEEEKVQALRIAAQKDENWLNVIIDEYTMTNTDRAAENLVISKRMIDNLNLPQTFAIDDYFARMFGKGLEEVVELSPLTWIPLIPLIALDNSVDLTRGVVSASSNNAFESCGFFFATPWVLYSTLFLQLFSLGWAVFNFWKLTVVKKMLLPTLVKESTGSEAVLLPPRYLDEYLINRFDSSPSIVAWGEKFFTGGGSDASPPRNDHEKLFGAVGSKFKKVYRDSIRFRDWLTVAQLVYFSTQIVFRDAAALYLGADTGSPDTLMPELALWSIFTVSLIFQLSLTPTAVNNYYQIISVEEYVDEKVVRKCILDYENDLKEKAMEEECALIENASEKEKCVIPP